MHVHVCSHVHLPITCELLVLGQGGETPATGICVHVRGTWRDVHAYACIPGTAIERLRLATALVDESLDATLHRLLALRSRL